MEIATILIWKSQFKDQSRSKTSCSFDCFQEVFIQVYHTANIYRELQGFTVITVIHKEISTIIMRKSCKDHNQNYIPFNELLISDSQGILVVLLGKIFAVTFLVPTENWVWLLLLTLLLLRLLYPGIYKVTRYYLIQLKIDLKLKFRKNVPY